MSYGNDGAVWVKIIFFGVIGVGALMVGMSTCESSGAANIHVKTLLKQKGYTDIRVTGSATTYGAPIGWACGEEDYHLVEFSGTNGAGNREEGFVCCGRMEPLIGYTKGCTIRN